MGPLELYKSFVREHSALVVNLERLAHWVVWNPERFNERSEFAYEAFNAAVGLLGLYNESIISSDDGAGEQTDWGFLLAAVEQVRLVKESSATFFGTAGPQRCSRHAGGGADRASTAHTACTFGNRHQCQRPLACLKVVHNR
jgi:hypothetical protein